MTKRKTNKEFIQEVKKLVNTEYTFLDTYKNNRTKLRVRHNECGNIYEVTPYTFLSGNRCPKCALKKRSLSSSLGTLGFKKKVFSLVGSEYSFLGEYKNNRTKVKMRHNKCGNVYYVSPSNFISRGSRCPKCGQKQGDTKRSLSNTQFLKKVQNLIGNEYTFLEKYINAHKDMKVKHNECGYVYKVKPYNFLYGGRRCPKCSRSIGEDLIERYLKKESIKFEPQKTLKGCKDKHLLSFDFYLPDYNILIEYQGVQHYKPVPYFSEEYFKTQQRHDKIKHDFALQHNYNFLTIPYTIRTQEQVNNILENNLKA